MLPCHLYQRKKVAFFCKTPVLNGASKENPANLALEPGDCNLDQQDFDLQEMCNMYSVPNFVCGSLLDIPFTEKQFGTVVLGEILEHCPRSSALKILTESLRVLKYDGVIVATFPYDDRAPEAQHKKEHLIMWADGISSWHQSIWTDDLFLPLIQEAGLKELPEHRELLQYGFCTGTGVVLVRA